MDHQELLDRVSHRLDSTDKNIDKNLQAIESLREDLQKHSTKTAVLETKMAGVMKVGGIGLTAIIGIIVSLFMKGQP